MNSGQEEETHAVLPSDCALADVRGSPRQLLEDKRTRLRVSLYGGLNVTVTAVNHETKEVFYGLHDSSSSLE